VATLLVNLGAIQQQQGNYSAAEPLFQRALSIRETSFGPDHTDLASIISNLAVAKQLQHNLPKAELLYRRALRIWEKAPGTLSPDFAQTLENLGGLYLDQHKYDEAGALFERAVTIKVQLGPEDPSVAKGLSKVAVADLVRGYYTEAEWPCKRSLDILEKSSPPDYPALIDALKNYACLLERTKRKAQAELLETRAMVYLAKLRENKTKHQTEISAE
jgi:tetratricopeptide (TPR) repeat protein